MAEPRFIYSSWQPDDIVEQFGYSDRFCSVVEDMMETLLTFTETTGHTQDITLKYKLLDFLRLQGLKAFADVQPQRHREGPAE